GRAIWLARDAVLMPVACEGSVPVSGCGAKVVMPPPAARSLIRLNSPKPWLAGDAAVVSVAGSGSVPVIGAEFATALVNGSWWCWFAGNAVVVADAGAGSVTVMVCGDV